MRKNNILFITIIMICFMFMGINGVSAKEKGATCIYKYASGGSNVNNEENVTITLKYDKDGKLTVKADQHKILYCTSYEISNNKDGCSSSNSIKSDKKNNLTVKSDITANDFLVNGYIQACPGTNDIDFVIKGKKVYMSLTSTGLFSWLNKNGLSASPSDAKKAKLTYEDISNGKTGGKKCTYSATDNSDKLTLVYWIKDKTPYSFSLSSKSTSGNTKKYILHSVNGNWTSEDCPKRVSITRMNDKTDWFNSGDKYKVYRGANDGKTTMELKENDDDLKNTDDDSEAGGIDPSDFVEGCGMWGSLLGIIKEILNTVRWFCAGGLVLLTMFDFTKAVSSGDDDGIKKAFKKFVLRSIILALIFILPTLIDFIFDIFSGTDGINVETCIKGF